MHILQINWDISLWGIQDWASIIGVGAVIYAVLIYVIKSIFFKPKVSIYFVKITSGASGRLEQINGTIEYTRGSTDLSFNMVYLIVNNDNQETIIDFRPLLPTFALTSSHRTHMYTGLFKFGSGSEWVSGTEEQVGHYANIEYHVESVVGLCFETADKKRFYSQKTPIKAKWKLFWYFSIRPILKKIANNLFFWKLTRK